MKTTKEPAGKWIELGHHHVISDETGKILAMTYVGAPTQPQMPIRAWVGNREIGSYISAVAARKAVDRAMGNWGGEEHGMLQAMIARFRMMREDAE